MIYKKILFTLLLCGLLSAPLYSDALNQEEKDSLERIRELRKASDLNIVLSYRQLSFNPQYSYTTAEAQIYIGLYEGLVNYKPQTLQAEPAIAQSWEISEDGKSYSFFLREDAKFSNGDLIRAENFKASWLQLIRAGSDAPFSSLLDLVSNVPEYRKGQKSEDQIGIKVAGPLQLDIELKEASPEFLSILCHNSLSVIHPSLLQLRDWSQLDAKKIITSGPYVLSSSQKEGLVFSKNPAYWNIQNVGSSRIFIERFQPYYADQLVNALNTYEVDWVASGSLSNFDQLNHPSDMIRINPIFASSFLFFGNTTKQSFSWSNPKVREALILLLPLEELRKGLGGSTHLVPKVSGYKSGQSFEKQDTDKAMSLLEEAGYPQGKGLGELRIVFPSGSSYSALAETIKEAWSQLDAEVLIEYQKPETSTVESYQDPNATLGIFTWIGDYPDPTTFLNLWRSEYTLNIFSYHSEEYDKLLDQAQQSGKDISKRYEFLSKAEETLLLDGALVPLWQTPALNFVSKRFLKGWYPNVLDIHPLHYLKRTYSILDSSI